MSVNLTINNLARNSGVRRSFAASNTRTATQPAALSPAQSADLYAVRQRLLELYARVEALAEASNARLGGVSRATGSALAISSAPLTLDFTDSATRLTSTEALNTVNLGFDPAPSAWSGLTTTPLAIFGAYDGAQGTDALAFTAQNTGLRSLNDLIVRISDGANNTLANVTVRAADATSTRYAIGNGLEFTLGDGQLVSGDSATLGVYDNIDNTIYTDQPFNGGGASGANFDPNAAPVTAGSFEINGTAIAVAEDDTLDAVLARINASAAGVASVFNPDTEQVELTQNTAGSAPGIIIDNDTSNLVDALKLTTAVADPGRDSDADVALNTLDAFATVSAGEVSVNGTAVGVAPNTDTLNAVVGLLDAADTDVEFTLDTLTRRASFTAINGAESFTLDESTTGLLTALNIDPGEYVKTQETFNGLSRRRSYVLADALTQTLESINEIFADSTFASGSQYVGGARTALNNGLSGFLSTTESRFGLQRNLELGSAVALDRRALTRSLQRDGKAALAFLRGRDAQSGLVGQLQSATINALQAVSRQLGIDTGIVDLRA